MQARVQALACRERLRGAAVPGALRAACFAAALLLVLLAAARDAHAHGAAPAPAQGPAPVGAGPSGGAGQAPGKIDSNKVGTSWTAWWRHARLEHLPATGAGEEPDLEGGPRDPRTAAQRTFDLRRHLTRTLGAPLLRALADDGAIDPDVRASALLALARVDSEPEAQRIVLSALRDAGAPRLVRESAALALGLFRRTDLALAVDPGARGRLASAGLDALDDEGLHERARCFAAFSLALLAHGPGESARPSPWQGELWERLHPVRASDEIPIALLVALGLPEGTVGGPEVVAGLRPLGAVRHARGGAPSPRLRAHALAALVRLEARAAVPDLIRALDPNHAPGDLVRAAAIVIEAHAARLGAPGRELLRPFLLRAVRGAAGPWNEGLLLVALGSVEGADLAEGRGSPEARHLLLERASGAPVSTRGWAVIALARALAGVAEQGASADLERWSRTGRALLMDGLAARSDDEGVRSAYAVAVGICGAPGDVPLLARLVRDRDVPWLARGHAAVSLALRGSRAPEAAAALVEALRQRGDEELRAQAALALAWMPRRLALDLLLDRVQDRDASEHVLGNAAIALGRMRDPAAVPALVTVIRDPARSDGARALAVAALGLVLDPEPRNSLRFVCEGALHAVASDALSELLTIL